MLNIHKKYRTNNRFVLYNQIRGSKPFLRFYVFCGVIIIISPYTEFMRGNVNKIIIIINFLIDILRLLWYTLKVSAERWPSGRRRSIGNAVTAQVVRGFESHPLLHVGARPCLCSVFLFQRKTSARRSAPPSSQKITLRISYVLASTDITLICLLPIFWDTLRLRRKCYERRIVCTDFFYSKKVSTHRLCCTSSGAKSHVSINSM